MKREIRVLLLSLFFLLSTGNSIYSQEAEFKRHSINTDIGIGFNEGEREVGYGFLYSLGWQKSIGAKHKLRINPNITFGEFLSFLLIEARDHFYRTSSLGLNLHYDLIRFKSVSIVTTGGGFINYSRGLLGTDNWSSAIDNRSEYFNSLYFGANASIGIRIDPNKSKIAYVIRPVNIHYGNKGFLLGCFMLGVDFKLKK
ncbi:MAG: hypothetical protein JEZ03_02960 [Bacteroidales bacterium]|nr:hypothetical protein [Bacteroidales bacterium]